MPKDQRPSAALPLLGFLQLELDGERKRFAEEQGFTFSAEPWLHQHPRDTPQEDHADRQRYSIWDSVVARLQRGELRAWGRAGSLSASERPIDADMWHASPMGNPAQGSVAFGDRRTGETWHRVHIAQMEDAPPATSGNRGTSAASAGKTAAKDATWREIAKHVRACRDQSPSDWAAMTQKARHLAVLKRAGHAKPPRGWSLETVQRVSDDPDLMS